MQSRNFEKYGGIISNENPKSTGCRYNYNHKFCQKAEIKNPENHFSKKTIIISLFHHSSLR